MSQQLSALRLSFHKIFDGSHGSAPGRAVTFARGGDGFEGAFQSHVAILMFEPLAKVTRPHEYCRNTFHRRDLVDVVHRFRSLDLHDQKRLVVDLAQVV